MFGQTNIGARLMAYPKNFQHHWHFVRGIHQLHVASPHKGLVMQNFDVFFVVNLN